MVDGITSRHFVAVDNDHSYNDKQQHNNAQHHGKGRKRHLIGELREPLTPYNYSHGSAGHKRWNRNDGSLATE